MKLPCRSCGIHFPGDYEVTLGDTCFFWEDRGLSNLPEPEKRLLWDWMFTMPADRIWLETTFVLGLNVVDRKMTIVEKAKNSWHRIIKGYNKMSEAERQAAQKKYFNNKVRF